MTNLMSVFKLSILIPTYNNGAFLPRLLDSIIEQAYNLDGNNDFEVLISDNASSDNTETICENYCEQYKFIKYSRHNSNIGFQGNVISLINKARGTFLWIIGSDDWIEKSAIKTVLQAISKHQTTSGITLEINTYSKAEVLLCKHDGSVEPIVLSGIDSIYSFNKIGYRFGFISAHVFRRDLALIALKNDINEPNAHLIHAMLTCICQRSPKWLFIDHGLVAWRSNNDSFTRSLGLYSRYILDVDCYTKNMVLANLKKDVVREFVNNQLMYCVRGYIVKSAELKNPSIKICIDSLKRFYPYYGYWLVVFPVSCLPSALIRYIRKLKSAC